MTQPQVERTLAAILVADVVGYSRLVETDEASALAAVKELWRATVEPLVAEHRGRIVKFMGDGVMAEFGSVVGAVGCAAAVQQRLADRQQEIAGEPRILLRIGVNLGDLVVEGDDLLGEGVNVAARLEQLCPPGSVLISGSAYEHLSGKLDIPFDFAGEQHLKNIARPVKTYRMNVAGSPFALPMNARSDKPSIAILPFDNMSVDAEQAYFSDGITEDIITELSRFGELMVIARNSSFAFRGQGTDLREIGRKLGAGYIVEGSVRRAGNRVRITAQLVEAESGTHLWAERYDRALEDVFAIQEEISQHIVATVAQRVRDDREVAARRRRPEDMLAYDLFLQGNRLSDDFTPGTQDRAAALFERAIEIDPTFARAYTGLAYIVLTRATDTAVGVSRQRDENRVQALRLAERALALDPNDPRVHCTLGFMCCTWRDFDRAERHLDLARSMNPNDPLIQIIWASVQGTLGRAERALAAIQLACRLNPKYPSWYNYYLSRILFQLERYGEAAALLEQLTFANPARHPRDVAWRTAAYGHLGRSEEAHQCGAMFLQAMRDLWHGDPAAGPAEYVDWLVDVSYLREPKDVERLREGLRLAGLPA
ncbi:adenylate/guanylate cyclase domain-containing protein [Rhizobium sp. RAF56]|jgi:TolB-like protein/class 3 adenylate cyclase/Flp pilus assembly protein TadD|uniref:adenylate/guanylate cyclase domain-containing protein n=1 Tax=Rhizobium sp. RAF56 TaxID=3233062 RepID=UPI003F9D86B0